jgi:hypothetical protein
VLRECIRPAGLEREAVLGKGLRGRFLGYKSFIVVQSFPLEHSKTTRRQSTRVEKPTTPSTTTTNRTGVLAQRSKAG